MVGVGIGADQQTSVCEDDRAAQLQKLERENEALQERLDFVEELVGPTECQRKLLQEQVLAARAAALRARQLGSGVPTKVAGRLDERLMQREGLSERDAGLLQGGCLPDSDGILQDVSLLGDPGFRPYDSETGEPCWQARGGMLQLSLGEVHDQFGEEISRAVVRAAKELDKYDASRRVGVELPWHVHEERELEPAEVIALMAENEYLRLDRKRGVSRLDRLEDLPEAGGMFGALHFPDTRLSPYAVPYAPPRRPQRGGPRRSNGRRQQQQQQVHGQMLGGGAGVSTDNVVASCASAGAGGNAPLRSARGPRAGGVVRQHPGDIASHVVPLPRLEANGARGSGFRSAVAQAAAAPLASCAGHRGAVRGGRGAPEVLEQALLTCHDRGLDLI